MKDISVNLDVVLSGQSEICICAGVFKSAEKHHGVTLKPGWFIRELALVRNNELQFFNQDCGRGFYVKKLADGSMEFDYERGTLKVINADLLAPYSFNAEVANENS